MDETTGDLLDAAHAHGITVTLGIWLGHERHGFDYTDLDQVAEQFKAVRDAVERYRDHPALLMWGIGNEMEGYELGDNAAVWSHVQACAALVKSLDPHHPTMTVIAEVGGRKVEAVHALCPDIDVVGINSYAGAASLGDRYREAGGTKPFVVAEFGPPGTWEVGRNAFDAAEELTSTAKGAVYAATYAALAGDPSCVGSYAFLWGHKVESTATWFGMFLADGSKLEAVDAMTRAWSGDWPGDRCPQIASLAFEGDAAGRPGDTIAFTLDAHDPERETLTAVWELRLDPMTYVTMGDTFELPAAVPDAVTQASTAGALVTLPDRPGVYRLSVTVKDPAGHAATANAPLLVMGAADGVADAASPRGVPVDFPFAVYTQGDAPQPWAPSGYMGNVDAITMDPNDTADPKVGATCLRVAYDAADEWGGVVWQDPPNDWGDQPGGYDLAGATALTFWARGAAGGEVVTFGFGLLGADATHPDSGGAKIESVRLTDQWQRYTIPVNGADLRRLKTGFYWTAAGNGAPMAFYLDDIRFVDD